MDRATGTCQRQACAMDTSLPYAVLSEPGAFALGTADGKAVDTAVRLLAEWLDRTSTQVTV